AEFNSGKPFLFEVMPENKLSIVFVNVPHFKGITCLGIQAKRMKREIYPGSVFLGIRFNSWVCIEGLFEEKLSTSNQISTMPNRLHDFFSEVNPASLAANFSNFELLEKGILDLSKHLKVTSDPLIKYISLQLEGGGKIHDFAKDIPLSIRPVQKHFKKITGVTMAEYRNINRLRNTVAMIYNKQQKITTAAFENGYTDHSHFMSSFKKFMKGSSLKNFLTQVETIKHQFSN
ncbi:MAG: helix-turn-helix transcriptional regulator, partial [Saprospiraceae bacterium]|nr:helix-turn-helix transcriptional regulator [Saprospiraceae bacterium]